jgi:hypothetical protein
MKLLSDIIIRGLAKHASDSLTKTASVKTAASRRWLMDADLVKLCNACKKHGPKRK